MQNDGQSLALQQPENGSDLKQEIPGNPPEGDSGQVSQLDEEKTEIELARETLNDEIIKGTEKTKGVKVDVEAQAGTFPQNTKLSIKPITLNTELNEIKEQIIDSEVSDNILEEAEIVAFDISFIYTLSNGEEIEVQPKNGEGVKVTFNYENNEELTQAEESENQEIQIFHINDKDEEGNKVESGEEKVEKIEINQIESDKIDNALVIDAESFSIYTVTIKIVTAATNYTNYNQINNWYADDLELYFLQSDGTTVKHFTIMDRNLGATEVYNRQFSQDANTASFGYHYQWGNNYGFMPCINNPCNTISNAATPDAGQIAQNIWSAYMPSKYARNTWSTSSNWMANSSTSDNIWGGAGDTTSSNADGTLIGSGNDWSILSGRQGPCPENYYIPSTYDWLTLKNAWGDSVSSSSNGTQFASDLLLPPAGYRYYNKSVNYQGSYGDYWSSSPNSSNSNYAQNLYFNSSDINPQINLSRSYGFSVRCAKSSPTTSTFTLHANGGSKAVIAFTGTVGNGKFTALGNPARSDSTSTFDGWYTADEGGEKLGVGSGVVSDIYARWNCASGYTDNGTACVQGVKVTLDANTHGGTIDSAGTKEITVAKGGNLNLSSYTGYKEGWNFVGWSENNTSTGAVNNLENITSAKTLYAVFSKDVTITFNMNGASGDNKDISCTMYNNDIECSVTSPEITAEGWTIIGYNSNESGHTNEWLPNTSGLVPQSRTYYAQIMKPAQAFTGNFEGNGASLSYTSTGCSISEVWNGESRSETCIVKAPDITREGWTIVGFNTTADAKSSALSTGADLEFSNSNSGVVYYAQTKLEDKTLTIHYLTGVGIEMIGKTTDTCTLTGVWNTDSQATSCTVKLPTITLKHGYSTGLWTSGNTTKNPGENITLTADTTYTANASLITYHISYVLNSGNLASANPTTYTVESGDIKLTDPTRIGYNFEGWTGTDRTDLFSGNYVAISSGSVGDREFVANWKAKTFTVTLSGEGISSTNIDVTYDSTYSSLTTPTRNGFVFSGWYDEGNNLIQSGDKVEITDDATFTAQWKVDANNNGIADEDEIGITITFTGGANGTLSGQTTWENVLTGLTFDQVGITIPEVIPGSGKVFSGWNPEITGGTVITQGMTITPIYADDANGNGENDDNEEHFTLEFTGGANGTLSGQTIWPNVLTGLTFDEAGITIPEVIPGSGKVFSGWNPEITGGTVITTGLNITPIYADDANGNGINDDNEQHFTLEFTGGDNGTLSGQTIWPNVLTGLTFDEAGITIPEVIPGSGKVFSGWNPEITGGTVITTGLNITPIYADDANGNGINDDTEQHFTLEFTGGDNGTLSGQTIWPNVLTGLTFDEAGITIPEVIPGSGKVFSGWNPEITGGTVITTGLNITPIYADDANGNGINDDNEQHFTLEFTGGDNGTLSGQTIWPNVLTGLTFDEAGITIPEVIPNSGKVFSGWNPEITGGTVITTGLNITPIYADDANGNGENDDNEEHFTLEFTGGTNGTLSGQTIWPNVLTGLTFDEAGITIPEVIPGSGKVFSGWNPEITGGTVITTGLNITPIYADDANGNGENDDNEEHFTLEFTGGTNGTLSGQTIWPNVLTGLTFDEAGITIPEVIPNSGYVFGGWTPKTPTSGDIVSPNYSVIWKVDANHNGIADDEEGVTPASGGNGGGSGGGSSGGGGRKDTTASTGTQITDTKDNNPKIEDNNKGDEDKSWSDNTKNGEEYDTELVGAYTWAKGEGITTMSDIQSARLYDNITREELAKMMVVFSSKILGKQPVISKTAQYRDVSAETRGAELANYVQLAYQYQIMGIDAYGNPLKYFNPSGKVTRAEFATVLSRVLYGSKYNQDGEKYYEKHIQALEKAGILTNTNPSIIELRGWIILMLYRSLEGLGK